MWNWKIIYTYFFQVSGVIQVPIVEYIKNLMFFTGNVPWYQDLINELWVIVPPMVFTWLIIKFVPIPNKWAFDLNVKNFYLRKKIEDDAKLKYEQSQSIYLKKIADIKQEQSLKKDIIAENTSEEEKWEDEYNFFRKTQWSQNFKEIMDIIYRQQGYIGNQQNRMSSIISYAHINDLISFTGVQNDTIKLTNKGKFFAKKIFDNEKVF